MPGTRSEDFLSTVRTVAARPGQVLDVVVLTSDLGLLETLRATAGSEHALWAVPSADGAVDYLVGGRCDILIADLGSLRGDVVALFDRLQSQFPELIVMATGRRDQEGLVGALLSSGAIYRFLHKPISPARASQFLNAATRRYNELSDAIEPVGLATVRSMASRPYMGAVLAGAGGVLAAIVVFAIWHSQQDEGLPATLQRTQVGDSPLEGRIQSKLGSAQIAYLSGRLSEPRDDNALDYYNAVLAMQPDNAEAKAGVNKVIAGLEARVTKALQARNAPLVVKHWSALQRAVPDHPQLDAMRAQLLQLTRNAGTTANSNDAGATRAKGATAARTKASANAPLSAPAMTLTDSDADRELADAIAREIVAQRVSAAVEEQQAAAAPVRRQFPLDEEMAAVTQLRERGALITPAGSNAYEALLMLRERYPNSEAVRSEQQRLAFVLLDRSRAALAANNIDEAATFIDRVNTLAPGMQAIRPVQEQLSAAQQQRDFIKNVAQAATLKRTREVPAVYPRDAKRAGTEGWVRVEFTITPEGTTEDLVVRDAEPAAVFDKAALDSVRKWRFEPIRKNGTPVAQRAVLQVRFVTGRG